MNDYINHENIRSYKKLIAISEGDRIEMRLATKR
ncbi:hypothetical protein J2R96_005113 [Bradyrhizobium elkanii]|jgi:hypothetical protein|nr:hypothetical protein [Bradyrhizobium elkanii]